MTPDFTVCGIFVAILGIAFIAVIIYIFSWQPYDWKREETIKEVARRYVKTSVSYENCLCTNCGETGTMTIVSKETSNKLENELHFQCPFCWNDYRA